MEFHRLETNSDPDTRNCQNECRLTSLIRKVSYSLTFTLTHLFDQDPIVRNSAAVGNHVKMGVRSKLHARSERPRIPVSIVGDTEPIACLWNVVQWKQP